MAGPYLNVGGSLHQTQPAFLQQTCALKQVFGTCVNKPEQPIWKVIKQGEPYGDSDRVILKDMPRNTYNKILHDFVATDKDIRASPWNDRVLAYANGKCNESKDTLLYKVTTMKKRASAHRSEEEERSTVVNTKKRKA